MQASVEHNFKGSQSTEQRIERAYTFANLSTYSRKKRFLIRAADLAFFVLIKLIGQTIRFEVEGWANWEAASAGAKSDLYLLAQPRVSQHLLLAQSRHCCHDFAKL